MKHLFLLSINDEDYIVQSNADGAVVSDILDLANALSPEELSPEAICNIASDSGYKMIINRGDGAFYIEGNNGLMAQG